MNLCGKSYQDYLSSAYIQQDVQIQEHMSMYSVKREQKKHDLFTAYLGNVSQNVQLLNKDTFMLESTTKVHDKEFTIKVIDCKQYSINPQSKYNVSQLERLTSATASFEDNYYYYMVYLCSTGHVAYLENRKNDAEKIEEQITEYSEHPMYDTMFKRMDKEYPDLLDDQPVRTLEEYKKIRQKALSYNCVVDILYNTEHFLHFLYEKTGIVGINNNSTIVCLANIDNLDNAFWSGSYMIFGNGKDMFTPLTSMDVVGHELSHGLVQNICNLEYKGHSGALNESYSDVIGTMFEFYMYEKYNTDDNEENDIDGEEDWLMGEDISNHNTYLRSMEQPENSPQPQPSLYKGKHYINPNSNVDYGGVHINSGIPNHCFYTLCQLTSKDYSFHIFMSCLQELHKNSDFIHFRDTLCRQDSNVYIQQALDKVGLHKNAISDMTRQQPPQQQPPQHVPRKPPRQQPPQQQPPRQQPPQQQPPRQQPPQQQPPQRVPRKPPQYPRTNTCNCPPCPHKRRRNRKRHRTYPYPRIM